jgi:hypothetical protein
MTNPLHAYVRFYLTVLQQLDDVNAALTRTSEETRAAVAPFGDVLGTATDPELRAALTAPPAPLGTAALWRPHDPAQLTGLVDVYEVIGRFTFQGEDDENLTRLDGAVRAAQDEVERQRRMLSALARVPAAATQAAEGLSQQELAAAEAARAERLKPFEPMAQKLREQCAKVLEAVRQVARPELANLERADAAYREYTERVQGLYAAGVPFLRRALQNLCAVAQVDVPPSWPERLPFAEHLPAELITPPSLESSAMAVARSQAEGVTAQQEAMVRTAQELTERQRAAEAEKVQLLARDTEAMAEVQIAKQLVRWATKADELDATLQAIDGQHQQKQARAALIGQLFVQSQQLKTLVETMKAEVTQREAETTTAAAAFEKERAHPPAIFGKDEWKERVEDLEKELAERRATLEQRKAVLVQNSTNLTALEARAQAEQSQITLIDKALEDVKSREELIRVELADLDSKLGERKPIKRLTVAQADENLLRLWQSRTDLRTQIDALTQLQQQLAADVERMDATGRQLAADKERLQGFLETASAEAETGRGEALKALAARRRASFVQHVAQVLAPLEQSLTEVDKIFIEPARQVLLQRAVGEAPKAGSLRAQAEGLAQAMAQLTPRLEPVLTAQAEVLKRVRADFSDKVHDAVKGAWSAA